MKAEQKNACIFRKENGKKIQAIRDKIEEWIINKLISLNEKTWLIACLLESADRIANTTSVYGAYLKKIKKSADKPMELIGIKPIYSEHRPDLNKVFCNDALEIVKKIKKKDILLTYIDPPYNHRQYSANYHILETIAKWDLNDFSPRGVTGLRDKDELNSDYSIRTKAENAYKKLFSSLKSKYIMMSYNNEGIVSDSFIRSLFRKYCERYKFEKIDYQRYKADVNHSKRIYKASKTVEYLIIGEMR